jgi:hypothetical protein
MSKVPEAFECMCACHSFDGIMHCYPCCSTCKRCTLRVKHGFGSSHEEKCKEKFDQLLEEINGRRISEGTS